MGGTDELRLASIHASRITDYIRRSAPRDRTFAAAKHMVTAPFVLPFCTVSRLHPDKSCRGCPQRRWMVDPKERYRLPVFAGF
jgi:hypothetical protein